jgi:serine/threonine protein kinase/tetratricopeptide (TPR) repeat protein
MVGKKFAHYRIVEKIGAGGMGEIYRAHDEQLDRDVAVKILPSGALTDEVSRLRFRKEALALAKLNHPNIETVHDFSTSDGVDYLVIELIPGITLAQKLKSGPMREKEILRLGTQLTEGVSAAHEQNVTHRDVKPNNLMIMPDGRIKILDFGLARFLRPAADPDATRTLTSAHALIGTLPYMAPEQLRGDQTGASADIYAIGAVLYEMATGRRPFDAEPSTALINDIINVPPTPPRQLNPSLSARLEEIILKCLEKETENRYQSAKELGVDLRRLAGSATKSVPSERLPAKRTLSRPVLVAGVLCALLAAVLIAAIPGWRNFLSGRGHPRDIESLAVLPLENYSHDPDQDYFADGMTDELITRLAQIGALRVISRTSVMRYKATHKPLPEIAKELQVDAVVEGSVERSGDHVQIRAKLIEAPTDRSLWAKSYSGDLRDILALQSTVAQAIAREIEVKVTPDEHTRLASSRPVDPDAYQLYLKGRLLWRKFTAADISKSVEFYQQAIEKDPTYAPAYAGLAASFALGSTSGGAKAPQEAIARAKQAAAKALELDESLGEAHFSLALVRMFYDWDWPGADREFRRAIDLNPNDAEAHHFYSHYFIALGRIEDSLAQSKLALELDPLSSDLMWHMGWHYLYARQYDEALLHLKKASEMAPNSPQLFLFMGMTHEAKKMFLESIADFRKVRELAPSTPFGLADLAHAYAISGNKAQARKIIDELNEIATQRYVSSWYAALIYTGLGEKEKAFASLNKALEEHSVQLVTIKLDPRFDPLRSDPRFKELLSSMNLPR